MKTVLITGASRGIGAAAAEAFARAGWAVAINYHTNRQKAEELAERLNANGYTAMAVQADVANKAQVVKMVQEVVKTYGRIDALVNNAGIANQCLVTGMSETAWNDIVGTNLSGAFFCTQEVLPHMIRQKQGAIVNVSSVWGVCGASCEVAYSAVKAGLIGMTKALAKEVGPSGIRVNCVAPGVIDTDMNANLTEEDVLYLANETPLTRIGAPQEVAQVILFLASEEASFITGQIVGVDGGFAL